MPPSSAPPVPPQKRAGVSAGRVRDMTVGFYTHTSHPYALFNIKLKTDGRALQLRVKNDARTRMENIHFPVSVRAACVCVCVILLRTHSSFVIINYAQ